MTNYPAQCGITWEKVGEKYPRKSLIHLAITGSLLKKTIEVKVDLKL